MKTLERGKDKIQKICDQIRHETLEPAKSEAEAIIKAAKQEAETLIKEAESQAAQLLKQAKSKIEQERNVFHSSLVQASKQAVEGLRQSLESHFFSEELQNLLDKQLADPKLIARLINGLVQALEKDGINADLTAVIPHSVSPEEVSAALLENVKTKLKEKPLALGNFEGGVQVKLIGKKMTLDLTDQALKELLSNYMRKDFRQIVFGH